MNQLSQKKVSLQTINIIKERFGMGKEKTNSQKVNEELLRPFTMEEIDAMLDEAEAAFEAGDYLTHDEVFKRQTKALTK